MGENTEADINLEIQRRIKLNRLAVEDELVAQERRASEKSRAQEYLRKKEQIFKSIETRRGVPIKDLEPVAQVSARRLLAGFALSMATAKVSRERLSSADIISPRGWKLDIGYDRRLKTWAEESGDPDNWVKSSRTALVIPNYRIKTEHLNWEGVSAISDHVVEESVVARLAGLEIEWVEPDTVTYK